MLAPAAALFTVTPVFFVNSVMDSCQVIVSSRVVCLHCLRAIQVSDCNFGVDLYSAGGWDGLSASDRIAVLNYGNEFRKQLQPLMGTSVKHGGFVVPCLVHCVTGYSFGGRGSVEGVAINAAFLKW
jgi:hypothetical protein